MAGKTTATVDFDIDLADRKIMLAIETAEKEIAEKVYSEVKGTSKFIDRTGNLRAGIKLYKSKYARGGYIVHSSAPHSHLIEYGTADRYDLERDAFRGKVTARPFMRPVGRKYKTKFIERIAEELELIK